MAASLLEFQRQLHADIERSEETIIDVCGDEDEENPREKVVQDHVIVRHLKSAQQCSQKLVEIYEDADGSRKEEVQSMAGAGMFDEFYRRMHELTRFHRNVPVKQEPEVDLLEVSEESVMFTGEESNGRYLDLHGVFEIFRNIPRFPRIDYLTFLERFPKMETFKRQLKGDEKYSLYLETLSDYLYDFMRRTQPLRNIDELKEEIEETFVKNWEEGLLAGWQKDDLEKDLLSVEQTLREEREKELELGTNPLYCAECRRLFARDTVFRAHLEGKKHKKAVAASMSGNERHASNEEFESKLAVEKEEFLSKCKCIARKEWTVKCLCEILVHCVVNTKINVEKRTLRSATEILEDLEAEDFKMDFGEEEEEDPTVTNPLKLPLGWDGKPIPLWLYKLHGLAIEFKCEICGNATYMGPRAFERHFQEARHQQGMKILGIRNTSHFHNVTKIADAQALWAKLQQDRAARGWNALDEEEIEDAEGDVLSRRTFSDMQQQGFYHAFPRPPQHG